MQHLHPPAAPEPLLSPDLWDAVVCKLVEIEHPRPNMMVRCVSKGFAASHDRWWATRDGCYDSLVDRCIEEVGFSLASPLFPRLILFAIPLFCSSATAGGSSSLFFDPFCYPPFFCSSATACRQASPFGRIGGRC